MLIYCNIIYNIDTGRVKSWLTLPRRTYTRVKGFLFTFWTLSLHYIYILYILYIYYCPPMLKSYLHTMTPYVTVYTHRNKEQTIKLTMRKRNLPNQTKWKITSNINQNDKEQIVIDTHALEILHSSPWPQSTCHVTSYVE